MKRDDTELVQVTLLRRTQASSPNPNALVAISSNKIVQFKTIYKDDSGYIALN